MKRLGTNQQELFGYMPLRAGLELITPEELQQFQDEQNQNALTCVGYLCPKLYTTRPHALTGEYYVVKGSWYKAKAIEPRIELKVTQTWELDLKNALFKTRTEKYGEGWGSLAMLSENGYTFPELDLGYRGASFDDLRTELLKLNKKATIETPFYINRLEPISEP